MAIEEQTQVGRDGDLAEGQALLGELGLGAAETGGGSCKGGRVS